MPCWQSVYFTFWLDSDTGTGADGHLHSRLQRSLCCEGSSDSPKVLIPLGLSSCMRQNPVTVTSFNVLDKCCSIVSHDFFTDV